MAKKSRGWLPTKEEIKNHKYLKFVNRFLHDEDLWHLNRISIPRAFAVGLFMAFVPVPFQMVLAVIAAIAIRANIAISVALVWITNPVTMPAIFYGCYKLGQFLLDTPAGHFPTHIDLSEFMVQMQAIWKPFLSGCFVAGVTASILGYIISRIICLFIYDKHHVPPKK